MIRVLKNVIRRLKFYLNNSQNKFQYKDNDTKEINELRENGITIIPKFIEKDIFIKEIFDYCLKIINSEDFILKCNKIREEKKKIPQLKILKLI